VTAKGEAARSAGTVCVTGASSQLGIFLVPRLRSAGYRILALSRNAPRRPAAVDENVLWLHPDLLTAGGKGSDLAGPPSHLVSCGPLDVACEVVSQQPSLQRVVAFSSSSVLSKMESSDRRERQAMAVMAGEETRLAEICARRKVPLLLLRPTLICGCGRDRNVSVLADLARRFGVIPLAGAAGGLRQPVHADDLAELAVMALTAERPLTMTSEACGGSTLSYREMAEKIAAAVPRRVRLLTLPPGLMAAAIWSLSRLPGWRGLSTAMVRRQSENLVFDDSDLRQALDWSPRPFEPTAADFEVPDYARSLQLPAHLSQSVL
jgi:nucleoside-diphosphate-sugar epimerase